MILGVNHITLSVPSLDQALEFYRDLLGFRQVAAMSWKADSDTARTAGRVTGLDPIAADAVHLRCANLVLEIFEFKGDGPRMQDPGRPVIDHGYTHICLAVTDIDVEYERLRKAGMAFIGAPVKLGPGLRTVYGRDPFGNVIELEEAKGRQVASQSALEAVRDRLFNAALGAVLLAIFLVFFLWQTPALWQGPLTTQEIDAYAAQLEQHAVLDRSEKTAFIERVRQWAAADDGRPVLLVNLMRYRQTLGELPPQIEFDGTPAEANAYYEGLVPPLALKRGEYPLIGGDAQATSLTASDAADANQWERVLVMRAPSRRAFIEFMADPAYGPTIPYKMAAMDVVLIPIDAEVVVPDLRWLVGGLLLVLFLFSNWRRTARKLRRASLEHSFGVKS